MKKTLIKRNFAAVLALALTGFCAHAQSGPDQSPDVLSLGGSVTEIIMALDQGHRLRGRDSTSSYPAEVLDLPDVGYVRALSPEGVLSVGPSLILSEEGAGPPEAVEVIRASNVKFIEIPDDMTPEGILRKIEIIGEALDVPDRASELSAQVKTALDEATKDAQRPEAEKKRILFILSAQGGKINASGTGTAADAMIRMAGGINAISDYEGYKQLTDEAVGKTAPDLILMMDRGGDHGIADDELFSMPAITLTPAAQTRSVVRMDGLLLLGFGPRTAEAVRTLNQALYGKEN